MPSVELPAMAACGDQNAMLANLHVVRDLHEVVNFCALADERRAERAAIHRHIRADLHVVADDDITNLRNLAAKTAVKNVAKTVRTNHRAGVNADALADLGAGIKRDVRKQIRFVTEHRIRADGIAGLQNHLRAQLHAFAHDAMRPDVRRRINLCPGRDHGGWMDAGGKFRFGKKHRQRLGERDARIRHADDNFLHRGRILSGDDRRGGAVFSGGKKICRFRQTSGRPAWAASALAKPVSAVFASPRTSPSRSLAISAWVKGIFDLVVAAHYKDTH